MFCIVWLLPIGLAVAAQSSSSKSTFAISTSPPVAPSASTSITNAQALQASGASPAAPAPSATTSDKCGPTVPDPTVPDSCDSFVSPVSSPAAYGVQCLNDGTGATLNLSSCEEIIPILCENQWQFAGEWLWASNNQCSLGSWLPPNEVINGTAPWPQQANCEVLVYGAMLDACEDPKYNEAAVNVRVLPNNSVTGRGEQVNVGYPSYVISTYQLRNVSDLDACFTNNVQTPCAALPEGQTARNLPSVAAEVAAEEAEEEAQWASESAAFASLDAAAESGFAAASGSGFAAVSSQTAPPVGLHTGETSFNGGKFKRMVGNVRLST